MDLLGLALALNLPLQGGRFTGDYSLDVTPTVGVPIERFTDFMPRAAAITLPGAVLYDPQAVAQLERSGEDVWHHELRHVDQQMALGPGFWPAYLATAGRPFEPDQRDSFIPSSGFRRNNDYRQMWMPPDSMDRNYSLFRLASELENGRRRTRLEFMPGYPRLLTIRPETERALLNLQKGTPSGSSKPRK